MSFRNIAVMLVSVSLLAVATAPGAAACADPHCPWSPVTMCAENVPDCVEGAGKTVADAVREVGEELCRRLC